MNVTLRPSWPADVWVKTTPDGCGMNLVALESHIRALMAARRWLKREIALREIKDIAK